MQHPVCDALAKQKFRFLKHKLMSTLTPRILHWENWGRGRSVFTPGSRLLRNIDLKRRDN